MEIRPQAGSYMLICATYFHRFFCVTRNGVHFVAATFLNEIQRSTISNLDIRGSSTHTG